MKTVIISGFPGVGKSYLFNNTDLKVLDSDSSQFSWVKDEKGNNTKERHPEFPNNYIRHIKENIGKVDIIMVSSHDIVRKALKDSNIQYYLAYPCIDLKDEYIERYKQRGNDEKFISFISENWDKFITDVENEEFPKKVKLYKEEYLGKLIKDGYCDYYKNICSVNETYADEYECTPCCRCSYRVKMN